VYANAPQGGWWRFFYCIRSGRTRAAKFGKLPKRFARRGQSFAAITNRIHHVSTPKPVFPFWVTAKYSLEFRRSAAVLSWLAISPVPYKSRLPIGGISYPWTVFGRLSTSLLVSSRPPSARRVRDPRERYTRVLFPLRPAGPVRPLPEPPVRP